MRSASSFTCTFTWLHAHSTVSNITIDMPWFFSSTHCADRQDIVIGSDDTPGPQNAMLATQSFNISIAVACFPRLSPLSSRWLRGLSIQYSSRDFLDTWYWLSACDELDNLAEGYRIWCRRLYITSRIACAIARSHIRSRRINAHCGRIRR